VIHNEELISVTDIAL